jgi:hypothetical protein
MKEPLRMGEANELPAALREAFQTMGRDAPSAETVLRVQRALQALPAAAPGAASIGTAAVGKLLGIAALVAGAFTSLVVLNRNVDAPHSERASRVLVGSAAQEHNSGSNEADEAKATLPASSAGHAAAAGPRIDLNQADQPAGKLAAPGRAAPPEIVELSRRPSTRPPRVLRAPAQASHARALSGQSAVQDKQEAVQKAQPLTAEQDATPDARAAAAPSEPAGAANAQVDEAQWLAECRRLALRDPEEALRKLAALNRQVPVGVFTEERELLAIRLHEKLGHSATAKELAQRFHERYPNSVYGRALPP